MIIKTFLADASAASNELPPEAKTRKPPGNGERINRIFRDALRSQQVHPLMDLIRRYRDKDAP